MKATAHFFSNAQPVSVGRGHNRRRVNRSQVEIPKEPPPSPASPNNNHNDNGHIPQELVEKLEELLREAERKWLEEQKIDASICTEAANGRPENSECSILEAILSIPEISKTLLTHFVRHPESFVKLRLASKYLDEAVANVT